jgi:hypothetical protein
MTSSRFSKWADWIVKIATMVLAVPASWGVADQAFADIGVPFRYVLQVAAVSLLEGVLVSNWVLLDIRKSDSVAAKSRYVLTVWVMYGAMLAVSILHGEGVAGVVFRVAFGLALVGSTWDTLVATWERIARSVADRGVSADWRVSWHQNALDRSVAKERASSLARLSLAEIGASEAVQMAAITSERDRGLGNVSRPLAVLPLADRPNGGNGRSVSALGAVDRLPIRK